MGLPYVLEGLLQSTCAQECALAYSNWRLELASAEYQKRRIQRSQALTGVASLDVLAELGSKLQLKMNALNAEVNALKRHVSTADAQAEDDDNDRRRCVASGASYAQWGAGVRDKLECNDDDNVYHANAGLTDQVHGANDNITGCELCPS
jgi:hypothetical protein